MNLYKKIQHVTISKIKEFFMIDKINKDIFLLKKFKRLAKKSKKTDKKIRNLFNLILFPIMSISLMLITISSLNLNLDLIELLFISFLSLFFSAILTLFLYEVSTSANYLYKTIYVKKIPLYIKREVYYLTEKIFISGKKIKKMNKNIEEMSPIAHDIFKRKYIKELSDENIKTLVIDSAINNLSKEDLYSNLTYYFEEIKKVKSKYQSYAYNCLMKRFLNNLNPEYFNENKIEIIRCIECYFNEYDQEKYFKELKKIKERLDDEIIKNNISKYKEDLLRENNNKEIKSENKILKSI